VAFVGWVLGCIVFRTLTTGQRTDDQKRGDVFRCQSTFAYVSESITITLMGGQIACGSISARTDQKRLRYRLQLIKCPVTLLGFQVRGPGITNTTSEYTITKVGITSTPVYYRYLRRQTDSFPARQMSQEVHHIVLHLLSPHKSPGRL
jgi:hypothetical protein